MFRPQPHFVTREVQRAWGIENPIGDPFGGAAYGEKNGGGGIGKVFSSVVPIVAGAAMIIGSGGALAPMVIGGAMMAGGAMSGIGAISGNQTLSKIGGITSAVAGVAALGYTAYSNWDSISNFFAAGTEASGAAIGGAEGGMGAVADMGQSYTGAMSMGESADLIAQGTAAADLANAQTAASFGGAGFDPNVIAAPLPGGTFGGTGGATVGDTGFINNMFDAQGIATNQAANAIANTSAPAAFSGTPAALPGGTFGGTGGAAVGDTGGFVSGMLDAGGTSGGLLSSVGGFIKENPVVSLMGLQTLSGLAEGASPKSQAEGEYLQAMTAMKEAEQQYLEAVKAPETAANTEYLLAKAAEFDKTKQYAEEKRAAYNASIAALQTPQTQNLAQTMYGGAQTGLLNAARA